MFGAIGSIVGIASGLNSLFGDSGGASSSAGQAAQQAVDPFASYRANLGAMYSGMLTGGDKTDITKMPGYTQFQTGVLDPALEASKRSSAASGMMRSGNEQIALQDIGQRGYYGFMTDYMNRLATGSGAGYAPAQGGMAGIAQGNLQQQGQYQALGGIAQGIAGLYGNSTGGNMGGGYMGGGYSSAPGGFSGGSYVDPSLANVQQANPFMAP